MSFLFSLRYFRVHFLIFVFVAFVVAAGCAAVVFPRAETHPTEVVFASEALHMVAALVFLDRFATLWAAFSVGDDPGEVFRLGV